jgi:hypothetical protein
MYVALSECGVMRQGYAVVKPENKAPSTITGRRQGEH